MICVKSMDFLRLWHDRSWIEINLKIFTSRWIYNPNKITIGCMYENLPPADSHATTYSCCRPTLPGNILGGGVPWTPLRLTGPWKYNYFIHSHDMMAVLQNRPWHLPFLLLSHWKIIEDLLCASLGVGVEMWTCTHKTSPSLRQSCSQVKRH